MKPLPDALVRTFLPRDIALLARVFPVLHRVEVVARAPRPEFEIPDRRTAAMRDDANLTIFLYEGEVAACPGISFTIQVDDVEAKHMALAGAGIPFVHAPNRVFWGYGAELCDPDGYRLEANCQSAV